jgi:hypothetical protein
VYQTAIADCVATLQELGHEAEYYATKGMCADDFAYYAERLTETEHHLAYLRHLQAQPVAGCALCCAFIYEGDRGTACEGGDLFCSEACLREAQPPTDLDALVF